eukprot:s712_g3.t1
MQVLPALKQLEELPQLPAEQTEAGRDLLAGVSASLELASIAKAHAGSSEAFCQKEAKLTREASYQLLRAVDHSLLASCGVGLQVFVASGQFPRRLRAGEARWLADAEPPDGYSLPEEIPCKRVCVYESQTNTQRFELAQTQTPLLAITCDEHSVNLSALQFLAHKLNCRVVTLRDQAHRCWNDFKGAVQDSSLWPCVNELMHCMNCRHGPWTSQAWFRQTKEALGLHTKKFGPGCPIFQALKDKLVFDMDSATSCEPGSLEEQELVFHKVSETVGAGVKGTRVNLTRWFEFISAYEDFQKEYHIHLYEYCLVLYHSGKLTCLADFPIWEAHQVPVEWKSLLKGKTSGAQKQSMQQTSNETKATERKTDAVNSLHMAAMILGQGGQFRRGRLLLSVGKVVHKAFQKELAGAYAIDRTFDYLLNHASQGHHLVFKKLWSIMFSLPMLEHMLFDVADTERAFYRQQLQVPASSSTAAPPVQLEGLDLHEKHLADEAWADQLWRLITATVKHRGLTMSQFLDMPLGQMVLLLSREESKVAQGLAKQKQNWQVLCAAEERQFSVGGVSKILDAVCFVEDIVVRELLVQLAEHDFQFVSPYVKETLETIYKGYAHTVVVERGFQKLEDICREQKNKEMSRLRRWYWLHESKVLQEFARPELQSNYAEVPPGIPRHLSKDLFHALGQKPSIDDELLKAITKRGKCDWAHCSAQGLQIQPGAWQLLVQAWTDNSWTEVSNSYMSLLAQEGTFIRQKSSNLCFVVLKHNVYGCLLWPAERIQKHQLNLFFPSLAKGTVCGWKSILDMSAWESLPTRLLPPACVASFADASETCVGVWCMQAGPAEPLHVAAAKRGFKGCPDNVLEKLLRHFGLGTMLKGPTALRGVLAKAEALIKHAIPEVAAADLASYLKHRSGLSRPRPVSLLLTGENLSLSEGVLEPTDQAAARLCRERQKTLTITQCTDIQFLQQRGYISKDEADSCMIAAGAVQPKQIVQHAAPTKEVWSWTEKHLKTCTPQVKGATIHEIKNQHTTSWVAKYKDAKPYASRTIAYGRKTGITSEQAARGCMIWLWNAHRQAVPEDVCPYKFADLELGEAA